MNRASLVLAGLMLTLTATATAQTTPAAVRAAAERINAEQVARDLNYLSADALRGRATFTAGFDSAANYIAARLERAGLEPMGDKGTYFQQYDVVSLTPDTSKLAVTINGKRFVHGDVIIQAGERLPFDVTAPIIYVGHGIRIKSKNIDPYAGKDVRGKILLVRAGVRPPQLAPGEAFPADAESFTEVARTEGVAGVIAIIPQRAVAQWNDLRRDVDAFQDLEPNVRSAYSRGGSVTSVLVRPGAIDTLAPGSATISVPLAKREMRRGYNIVARLPGSDARRRNEYVTVAAHLDGAVIENYPVAGDSIYNAADDNASGSAGMLAVAEQLARAPRAKRSIVFIWDSGEEIGLYGTRAFVGEKVVPPNAIVTHINMDMIGASRRPNTADSAAKDVALPNEVFITGPRVLSASMDSLLQRINRDYPRMQLNYRFDSVNDEFFYPRTDAGPFLERGVMILEFFTGIHDRYHSPQDEVQHLDVAKVVQVSKLALAVMHAIANADAPPTLDKGIPASVPRY